MLVVAHRTPRPKGPTAPAGIGTDDTDKLPTLLSPSRALDWEQCPAKFYFSTILRLRSAATVATTKGTLAHEAFERIFDHPAGERTPDIAVPYVRKAWERICDDPEYDEVNALGPEAVEQMLQDAEEAVRSWFRMEDPNRFEPNGVEVRMAAEAVGVPLHGIIDRLDRVIYPDGTVRWIISDYKTGKVPDPTSRYIDQKFFGMRTYAVLFYEMFGIVPDLLRLVYVIAGTPEGVLTMPCDKKLIDRQTSRLRTIWKSITAAARVGRWETRTQPLCQWCDHMDLCPAWHPELEGVPVEVPESRKRTPTPTAA